MIKQQIFVEAYRGDESIVGLITELIESRYSELFYAVLVHGSVASDEVISYSDFDGLLIIRDSYKNSTELAKFIKESMSLIYRFDPLQHHGWFILTENQLSDYPENQLPFAVLKEARVIYPNEGGLDIIIAYDEANDYGKNLVTILESIDQRLRLGWRPKNAYQAKSFLSQIMLLPSLYYAAKNNCGICKKDSFPLVEPDFSKDAWKVQQLAAQIRQGWDYNPGPVYRRFLGMNKNIIRKVAQNYLSPRISPGDNMLLGEEFFRLTVQFVDEIRRNIKGC